MKLQQQSNLLVSIIIPTYGRAERLPGLIQQLLAQKAEGISFEIIVVDDGSPQDIRPIVEAAIGETDILVSCLRKENGGPASARNFGAAAAQGEYLIFVDDDMLLHSNFLQGHIDTQRAFGPAVVNCDYERQIESEPEPFRRWYQKQASQWAERRCKDLKPIAEDVFRMPPAAITSANLSVRRIDFERAGGFDTQYPFGCEDQDLGIRLGVEGIPSLLTQKSITVQVESHTKLKVVCQRQRIGARDTVRFIRRFAVAERYGEPSVAASNGPLRLGKEPLSVSMKKVLRQLVTARYCSTLPFVLVSLCERACPESKILQHLYSLVVGAYLQKGWREGLNLYREELPLPEWAVTSAE